MLIGTLDVIRNNDLRLAQELRQLGHGGVGEDHHAGARGAEQRRAQQQQPG